MTVSKRSLRIGGNMLDKDRNGIPDYIESYALMIVGIILIFAGLFSLYKGVLAESTAMRLVYIGLALLLGDGVVKKFIGG